MTTLFIDHQRIKFTLHHRPQVKTSTYQTKSHTGRLKRGNDLIRFKLIRSRKKHASIRKFAVDTCANRHKSRRTSQSRVILRGF